MITFFEEDVKSRLNQKINIRNWIESVLIMHDKKLGEISYIFCSDEYILKMNNEHLGHDYYTDVITFDYVEGNVVSGDIFISVDTVASNAALYKCKYKDELHRVMIHGVLHLCGLKDKTERDALRMRKAEDEALELLEDIFYFQKNLRS